MQQSDDYSGPYKDEQQIKDLEAGDNDDELQRLYDAYMVYFAKNQCAPIQAAGWEKLGAYFMKLSMEDAHGLRQSREDFEKATAGMLKQPIPEWIKEVVYVQSQMDGLYYLALPPKELATQAYLHTKNRKAKAEDYIVPPIYNGIMKEKSPEQILNTRICDYVISHCG